MKKLLIITGLIIAGFHLSYGQNNVGIGTSSPNANTMLDVQATSTKNGILAETAGNGIAIQAIGRGNAAAINVLKPANSSGQGIYIEHQGTDGPVAQIRRTNANASGAAIIGYNNSTLAQSPAIYALHEGTGDPAFVARISNTQSANAAVFAETNGGGPAIFASQLGTGRGAQIQITNAANAQIGVRSFTSGTGKAGLFTISNAANNDTAFMAETNGTGYAFAATQKGEGRGATFNTTNVNGFTTLEVNSNSSKSSPAVMIFHNGTGDGSDALQVRRNAGTGSAGRFLNYSNDNNQPALNAETWAANGTAFSTSHQANGIALAALAGGIRVSTASIGSGTSVINTRATAYMFGGGGPSFTFGFGPANGEVFMFYNNTGATITITSASVSGNITVPANSGKLCVVIDGVFRPM